MGTATKPEFEVVRRNRVYEEVAKQIERLILKKLQPGDKLPSERDLAEINAAVYFREFAAHR